MSRNHESILNKVPLAMTALTQATANPGFIKKVKELATLEELSCYRYDNNNRIDAFSASYYEQTLRLFPEQESDNLVLGLNPFYQALHLCYTYLQSDSVGSYEKKTDTWASYNSPDELDDMAQLILREEGSYYQVNGRGIKRDVEPLTRHLAQVMTTPEAWIKQINHILKLSRRHYTAESK